METALSVPSGLLQNSRRGAYTTAGSSAAAATWARSVGVPVYDIVPTICSTRVISVTAETPWASSLTLTVGFLPGSKEQVRSYRVEREFAALVEFGTANGRHSVEIDVSLGNRVCISGDTCEVSLLEYTTEPEGSPPYWLVDNFVGVAHLPCPHPPFRTQRALFPLLVASAFNVIDTLNALRAALKGLEP